MTGIAKRLRAQSRDKDMLELCVNGATAVEAADEIDRLEAEIEQLRDALMDRPRDDGTAIAVGGEPGAPTGKSE